VVSSRASTVHLPHSVRASVVTASLACAALFAMAGCSDGSGSTHIVASAALSASEVAIGVPVRFEVTLEYPTALTVEVQEPAELLKGFGTKGRGEEVSKRLLRRRNIQSRWYEFVAFEPGEYVVRWPEITYSNEASPSPERLPGVPLALRVVSVLDPNATDVRGIKPPVDLPAGKFGWILAAAVGAALLLLLGVFLLLRRRRKSPQVPPPAPHEVALAELDRLAAFSPGTWDEVKGFYYRLSLCVRVYIESRFGVEAPHQTTQEFLSSLATSEEVLGKHRDLLGRFLAHCDSVKFARYFPNPGEVQESLRVARRFVEETRALPEESSLAEVGAA